MQILVYQDYVQNNGVLLKSLLNMGHAVSHIDAADILAGALASQKPDLFILPGGADLYFCEKLNGEGNRLIRQWVEQGGNILGICAGAYYCCEALLWDAEAAIQRIDGARELGFVPATAIGPVKEFIQDGDIRKSWMSVVSLNVADNLGGGVLPAFYWGGPFFAVQEAANCQVMARYAELNDKPPAIISCNVGRGLCITSAVHIEFTDALFESRFYTVNNTNAAHEKQVLEDMKKQNMAHPVLLERVLKIFEDRKTSS